MPKRATANTAGSQSSPTPPKPSNVVEFDFYAAMQRVEQDSAKVTRLEWKDTNIYVYLFNDRLSIRLADGKLNTLIVSRADMQGTDWVVV